jgi:hypothetical protein
MKKSNILIGTGLSVLLAVGLYAHGGYENMGPGMMNNDNDQQTHYNQSMQNNGYPMMNGNYPGMNNGYGMMGGNYQGMNYGYGMMGGNYPGMNNGYRMMGGNYPGINNGYGMMYGNMPMMNGNHHFSYGNGMMNMFYGLNLTQDQMEKIYKIQMDMYKNIQRPDSAFTKKSFDKDKYIKIMNDRRDNIIKSRAETIAKIYEILTPNQKEGLKNMMNYIHGIR